MMFVESLSDAQPGLRSEDNVVIDPMTIGARFQGGDYVDGGVRFWAQDNANGRAIRCELIGLRFRREGEHFGAERTSADNIFGAPAPVGAAPANGEAPAAAAPAATGADLFG